MDGAATSATGAAGDTRALLSQRDITFVVSPPEIVFRNYEPFQTYETPLVFKNQARTVKSVKVLTPESRYFKLSEPRTTGNTLKVAAGLSVAYTVHFRPEEDADYACDLVALTESERFLIQVRAYTSRGRLDFKPAYDFPAAPVKYNSERVMFIRNVGIKPTTWTMSAPLPWTVEPGQGYLEPGDGMQMSVFFRPEQCERYQGDLLVNYSNGDVKKVKLTGEAKNAPVTLKPDVLTLEPTFISLERQGVVTIINDSDVTVSFKWKAHATHEQEMEEKHMRSLRLKQKEAAERELILSSVDSRSASFGGKGSGREIRALNRRLQGQWQQLEQGALLYEDDYFTIEPLTGDVPARSRRDIVVTFNPQLAATCEVAAYLDIVGRSERLPLTLKGQGVGPKCQFSYDALDLGDVFINSIRKYEVMLQNRGSIDARFSLNQTSSMFAKKFKFKPSHGTVAPGDSQAISIIFCSDRIGILNEVFHFHIQGSGNDLGIHIKGRVIGPTFHFDTDEIDFGNVSYNFMHRRAFHLVNTSEIPMKYRLRVPEDSTTEREFDPIPATGLVLPHGKQKIVLDFLSNTVQEYNAHLVVDIDEVGENLHSIPLKASCIVPNIQLAEEAIDFGRGRPVFVGHPYDVFLGIKNDTPLSSKYEVGIPPPEDPVRKKLKIEVHEKKGIVPAVSTHQVQLTLTASQVGSVHLPVYVRVLGSDKRLPVSLSAKVSGPNVAIDQTTLDFGKVSVLTEHCKKLEIVNASPIPAVFNCRLTNANSPAFVLKNAETTIPPKSSFSLSVYCFLDDTSKFSDELIISVANSKDINVGLVAVGSGTTLVPSISLEHDVDFGSVFTTSVAKKTFTLHNKGKRPLQISWQNDRAKPKEGEPPFAFTITPDRATILGKSEQDFVFEGSHATPGRATERFVCKLQKTHKLIFRPTVVGMFVVPLVEPSDRVLNYTHVWDPANPERGDDAIALTDSSLHHTRPLTLRNISPMALSFSLKPGAPFTIDKTDYELRCGESCTVHVNLFAGYRHDRQSHKIKTKLTIAYKDHPQREHVDLLADIVFPNVTIEGTALSAGEKPVLDFGCIMQEAERRVQVVVTNTSKVNAKYEWVFEQVDAPPAEKTEKGKAAKDAVTIAGCSAFDVLPIRGYLKPGEKETLEFVYHSQSMKKARAMAILVVDGGPEYPVMLQGEASSMHFRFDRSVLDFGNIPFERFEEREVFLQNIGRVAFNFKVDLTQLKRPGCIEVTPPAGTIKGGEKLRLLVRLYPRVPDRTEEFFQVHVAHFEPHSIYVRGMGLYPSVSLSGASLTRIRPKTSDELVTTAQRALTTDGKRYFLRDGGMVTSGSHGKAKLLEDSNRILADVEEEVERLYFAHLLDTETPPPPVKKAPRGQAAAVAAVKRNSAFSFATNTTNIEIPGQDEEVVDPYVTKWHDGKPIIACYSIDFGTVVKGDVKKKAVRIQNTSPNVLSVQVDKRGLGASGVTLTPEKITKLQGHPVYAETTVEVQLATRGEKARGVTFGSYRLTVPLEVKGGGYVMLEVKAFIMVPQLSVSHSPLDKPIDFHTEETLADGTVKQRGTTVGETRIVSLQLKNPLPLPCEWSAKAEVKRGQPRNHYICKPERGVLGTNERCTLEVMFVPTEGGLTNGVLNLKIAQNPKVIQIPLVGTGEEILVDVAPALLSLDPVQPFVPTDGKFVLRNKSLRPIEIYARPFDRIHVVEEEILSVVDIYDADGVALLPPREVGGSLDDGLLEQTYAIFEQTDHRIKNELVAFGDGPDDAADAPQPDAPPAPQAADADKVSEKEDQATGPIVVVMGPPLAGKTTLATTLAEEYHCERMALDDLFEAVALQDTEAGMYVRNLLNPWPGMEPAEVKEGVLASVLQQKFQRCADGLVIDGIESCVTPNGHVLGAAIAAAATALGRSLKVVSLDLTKQCIDYRQGTADQKTALAALEGAKVPEQSEEAYDAMEPAARRAYERSLKRLRKARKDAKAATDKRQKLEAELETVDPESVTILQEVAQEEEARAAAEAEELANAKGKKAPPKKGGKNDPPPTEAPPPPPVDLTPIEAFKKAYMKMEKAVTVNGEIEVVKVRSDLSGAADEIVKTLVADGQLPAPAVLATACDEEDFLPISPVTKLRLERHAVPPPAPECKWFTILDEVDRPQSAAKDGAEDPKKAKGKPAADEPVPDKPPPTRWILGVGESVKLTLRFQASQVLPEDYAEVVEFGIVGSRQVIPLTVKAVCVYPDVLRDPKQVFEKRRMVKKGVCDFGPLLVRSQADAPAAADKAAKGGKRQSVAAVAKVDDPAAAYTWLKITNEELFAAEISWMFQDPAQKCFSVVPAAVKLPPGGTERIKVIAQPDAPRVHEHQLVGLIKDSPKPVVFNMACLACLPEVEILGCEERDGEGKVIDFDRLLLDEEDTRELTIISNTPVPLCWELVDSADVTKKLRQEFVIEVVTRPEPAGKDARGRPAPKATTPAVAIVDDPTPTDTAATAAKDPKGGKGGKDAKNVDEAAPKSLGKGRLEAKGAGAQGRNKQTIQVHFLAPKADVMKCELSVLIKDVGETTVFQTIPIKFLAEAYDLYLEATEEITFGKAGLVKVGMPHKAQFKLCNRGKYAFNYEVKLKRKLQQYFQLDLPTGVLKPREQPTTVEVTFEAKQEVFFRDTQRAVFDVNIYQANEDGSSGMLVGTKPLFVDAEARNLRFQTSQTHINFGPCLQTDRRQIPFDILNNGPFELKFKLYDISLGPPDKQATPEAGDKKAAPKKPAPKGGAVTADLEIGAFRIAPFEGVVAPGDTREITVCLDPTGAGSQQFSEKLGIYVEDCHPSEMPEPLLLEGESCTPGITADITSPEGEIIFEEQQIVSKLDAFHKLRSVFARDDRVFSFGPIITHQSVTESFRISNPFTVPCTVTAAVKKRGDSETATTAMQSFYVAWATPPGSQDAPADGAGITIPPHQHRYCKVTFLPTEMRRYFALFECVVKDGTDPKSKELVFEIRGEGTLPQLQVDVQPAPMPKVAALEDPAAAGKAAPKGKDPKAAAGAAPTSKFPPNSLVFPRTLVGRKGTRYVTITNVGDLPAEFKFNLSQRENKHNAFAFPSRNDTHTLHPNEKSTYPVYFEPTSVEEYKSKIMLSVKDNTFEDTCITLVGEGYSEECILEGLDEGCDNFLSLNDCGVGMTSSRTFTLESTGDEALRYAWCPKDEDKFTVVPSQGHLLPRKTRSITVNFKSTQPEDFERAQIVLKTWQVKVDGRGGQAWDNSLSNVRWEPDITPPDTPQAKVETPEVPDMGGTKGAKDPKKPTPKKDGKGGDGESPSRAATPVEPQLTAEEVAAAEAAKALERKRRPLRKVTETPPEPTFEYVTAEDAPNQMDLFVKVACDYSQWEVAPDANGASLTENGIQFATTKLFQTRSVPLTLRNSGKTGFECQWKIVDADGMFVAADEATFSIQPDYCTIPPGGSQTCMVRYSPLDTDAHNCTLRGFIPHVKEDEEGTAGKQPAISLRGFAECPLVHFELDESDYLASGQRNPELPGPGGQFLDPMSCRVLEFACSGVKVRATKRFYILNPTNLSYEFEWTDRTGGAGAKQFTCHTKSGVVHSGKKAEMCFDFMSDGVEVKESFWEFKVFSGGSKNLGGTGYFTPTTVPFLLVGKSTEPNVALHPNRLNYDQVLLGARSKKTVLLSNSELIPFGFQFQVPRGVVSVSPLAGTIGANATLPVEVVLAPTAEDAYNINIVCNIKKKVNPLTCNVKGEGYSVHESVVVRTADGQSQLLTPGEVNYVDFGRCHINAQQKKEIIISNSGNLHFDYKWSRGASSYLTLSPEIDTVSRGGRSTCELVFFPTKVLAIEQYKMVLKVTNGATYTLMVNAQGVQPNVNFSTQKLAFGPQFVQGHGSMELGKALKLVIINEDPNEVSFECEAELPPWLHTDSTPSVLAKAGKKEAGVPLDRKEITFYFRPTEVGLVETVVPFQINGLFTVNVVVSGEGTVPKVELAPGHNGTINFGSVRAGDIKSVSVKVFCKSKITTPFSLLNVLPPELTAGLVTVTPNDAFQLKPREVRTLDFKFKPPVGMRLTPFNHAVEADIAGARGPFLTLMGASIGLDVHLDSKTLSFGSVVQGTAQTRRVIIINTGDVPVSYQWPELDGTGYSVAVPQGYIAAHGEAACEVVYAPSGPTPQGTRELNIKITDATVTPPSVKTLPIALVGVCTKRPAVAEEHTFKCVVRETNAKNIKLTNPTNEDWVFAPALDSACWNVPEKVTVPANGAADVPVTYAPLAMTKTNAKGEKEFDKGTLFFPLPTGDPKQMMHGLVGESSAPAAAAELEESMTAKTMHTILIPVENWLPAPQRFSVVRDFMQMGAGGPTPIDNSITISGGGTIDVPGRVKRSYKLTVQCFREGKVKGTVRFVNDATKEYIFYNVAFNVKAPGSLRELHFKTPARQAFSETIVVENPTDAAVVLEASCTGAAPGELTFADKLPIEARSSGRLAVEYLPLVPGQTKQAKMLLKCTDLGEFPYTLNLTALPSVPERAVRFQAPLGQTQQVTLKLKSLAKTACDYTCKFTGPSPSPFYKCQQPMVVKAGPATKADGEEFSFDLGFEPCKLGEVRDVLEISSPVGGTYEVTLIGTCSAPQRQGPFECKAGQAKVIPFKNVFNDQMTFSFATDSQSFTVAKPSEVAPAKKDLPISVTYKPSPDDGPHPKAKLTVTCQQERSSTPVTWVFYLSGTS
eukprot:TRINITY_DN349_c0_g2_i1.p1 TRINITY_DN349_c0_g2~~TRINITY_DN349_c0_g2_i1.p1  ORF type:complete len:4697 (+),score=2083.13 TRINITY_DN349_c0_g2_i1:84-14174(+)